MFPMTSNASLFMFGSFSVFLHNRCKAERQAMKTTLCGHKNVFRMTRLFCLQLLLLSTQNVFAALEFI